MRICDYFVGPIQIRNGKPHFPLGLYLSSVDSVDLATIGKSKFNMIMPCQDEVAKAWGRCGRDTEPLSNLKSCAAMPTAEHAFSW